MCLYLIKAIMDIKEFNTEANIKKKYLREILFVCT